MDEGEGLYIRFKTTLQARLQGVTQVAVGFSGGLDSTVLLHLLWRARGELDLSLRAIHVHHGLSPHAEAWVVHCTERCADWEIPLLVERVKLASNTGQGVEGSARAARYGVFGCLSEPLLLLAQHRDDQAETVLYRLMRGAGVHGAAGMPAERAHGRLRLLRPLLDESRAVLHAYAQAQGLTWVEDESNQSTAFDRNFLRAKIMPPLRARFAAADENLLRAAQHFREAAGLLDELARADAGESGERLSLARLALLSQARQRNLLRWFLARFGLQLETRQLQVVLQQMLHAAEDSMPCFALAQYEVRRYRGELYVTARAPSCPPQILAAGDTASLAGWAGQLNWLSATFGLDPQYRAGLTVRVRQGGEVLRLRRGGPTRPLKLLFQEGAIAPWLRQRWPLLYHGETLVAVPNIGVAAEYQVSEGGYWPQWLAA